MNSFPKIYAVGTPYIRDIFSTPVEVTEKLDGSQFAFTLVDGEVKFRSKGNSNGVDKMFNEGVAYILAKQHLLNDDWVYYGEYFAKPKHNTLAYDRIPQGHVALFAIMNCNGDYLQYDQIRAEAEHIGISIVNRIFDGYVEKGMLEEFLKTPSALGGTPIEGVVIKNYLQGCNIGDQYFPITCGKFVSETFKEVHRERWGREETQGGKLQGFFESFRTEARFHKAVQHLKERGELTETPKDIGALMKELCNDLETEESQVVKEWLYLHFRKDFLKVASRGMPEWYKEKIMNLSFGGDNGIDSVDSKQD